MTVVDLLEARKALSRLVDAVDSGAEPEIVITRDGRPAARLVPLEGTASGPRLGVAHGQFVVPDDVDADNDVVAGMFGTAR